MPREISNSELPKTLAEAFLLPLEPNDGCEFKPASNAKSFFLPNLNVYVKDKLAGVLVQEDNAGVLERVFVSEDATIECTNAEANASFKKGWNLVFTDKTTKIGKVIASSTAPWTFTGDITNPNPDTTPPTVIKTVSTSAVTVDISFSETIKNANIATNYTIFPELAVSAATVAVDGKTVTLTTAPQTKDESYAVLVSSTVTDLAGNPYTPTNDPPFATTFIGTGQVTGELNLVINGLPEGVLADVLVTGPASFSQTVTATTTLSGLSSGTYQFQVKAVKPKSATFSDNGSPSTFSFNATTGGTVNLTYSCTLVTPPDANLDAVLKTATGKETYNCADLAALTTLDASNKAIQNIEGLQYAVGLTNLNLGDNALSSLPENIFDNLTNLTNLILLSMP